MLWHRLEVSANSREDQVIRIGIAQENAQCIFSQFRRCVLIGRLMAESSQEVLCVPNYGCVPYEMVVAKMDMTIVQPPNVVDNHRKCYAKKSSSNPF